MSTNSDTSKSTGREIAKRLFAREFNDAYLFGPVEDFGECRVHVFTEKVQDGVLPAGNSVAGRVADLDQCCISKFSCDRDSLFDEAEENLLHKDSSSASSQSF